MKKSFGYCLTRVVYALLDDAQRLIPESQLGGRRDKLRISQLVRARGVSVFTLDLPAHLKHFDRCLSSGTYVKSGLPLSRTINSQSPIPRLFQGLVLRIFDETGSLRHNPCTDSIALLRQLYAVGKKAALECKDSRVYETISDFYSIEKDLPEPDLNWNGTNRSCLPGTNNVSGMHCQDYAVGSGDTDLDMWCRGSDTTRQAVLGTVQQVADTVTTSLGFFDPTLWMPKHGPGAVADLKSYEFKYDFKCWSERLETVFPYDVFAFANYNMWADSVQEGNAALSMPWESIEDDIYPSRLICVPKTQKGPRLIAAEPVAHQWCQQVIWNFLDDRVHSSWLSGFIKFRDQKFNQEGARLASLDGSGWTVDLSAASDRLTCRLVERLFRGNPPLLKALYASRTTHIVQGLDKKISPDPIPLKKFSTMGSACTFPIQTLSFLMLAIAATLISRQLRPTYENMHRLSGTIRVFGDDIVVPSDAGEVLEVLLTHFSFKVNQDKTHRTGLFRESCGLDAYKGVEVTPAYYVKVPTARKPESIASAVECSNNFYFKGYWATAEEIRDQVGIKLIPVIHVDSGLFGFKSYSPQTSLLKQRWNKELQRTEFWTMRITAKSKKTKVQTSGALLQYFTEGPRHFDGLEWLTQTEWESGIAQRARVKLRACWEDLGGVTGK